MITFQVYFYLENCNIYRKVMGTVMPSSPTSYIIGHNHPLSLVLIMIPDGRTLKGPVYLWNILDPDKYKAKECCLFCFEQQLCLRDSLFPNAMFTSRLNFSSPKNVLSPDYSFVIYIHPHSLWLQGRSSGF